MIQSIFIPMLLGFAVFLFGMKLMELALHRLAGPHLSRALQRSTKTPIHGLATGTVTTAFLQSSTAVTVISIGLVNAKILTFPRTLGILLGTNIGTCLTTELIGLNIHELAIPLLTAAIAVWFITAMLGEARLLPMLGELRWLEPVRSVSVAVCGFGLLLSGLSIMQSIGPAVQNSGMFAWFLDKASTGIWWGLLAGAVLTAAIHSSAAVIGLVMGFVTIGAMPIELGVALVLGANIGTCVTALLASIGGSRGGRYVAYAHILLNVGGALLFLPFTHELASLSGWLSHSPASQIAHAQTIFNIACSVLALPICYMKAMNSLDVSE